MQNLYNLKTATKDGACDICYSATPSVLANSGDFFFVCLHHLKDVGFCKPLNPIVQPDVTKEKDTKEKVPKETDDKKVDDKKVEKDEKPTQPVIQPIPKVYILDHYIFLERIQNKKDIQQKKQNQLSSQQKLNLLNSAPSVPKK